MSSLQLIAAGMIVLIVSRLVVVHRRRTEVSRVLPIRRTPAVTPRTCVVLRRFGEDGDHTPWSRN